MVEKEITCFIQGSEMALQREYSPTPHHSLIAASA